jgi:hypothetical protein
MIGFGSGQPNAEGAKITQRPQKNSKEDFLVFLFAPSAKPLRPLRSVPDPAFPAFLEP